MFSSLMELSGRDKDIGFPPSSGYNPLASAGSAGGGGGGGDDHRSIDNGGTVFKPSQTPHCHPLLQQEQELNPQHQSLGQGCDPDPDAVHIAGVVAGATIASSTGGSNSKASVRYRECLKNHAASIGGNIVDGCGEFMPDGEEGTLEALMCAACNCHRNFHRKEVDGETNGRSAPHFHAHHPPSLASPPYLHRQKFPKGFHAPPSTFIVPPMSMAFGTSIGATESSSEDLRAFNPNAGAAPGAPPPFPPPSLSKKRFRTKFTQEQKEKMLEYAEKVGWRMQKQYEEQVQKLCAEVGVKRHVFKVWMHNNKNALKKPDQPQQQSPPL